LDDLDDEGKLKKKESKKEQLSAADGGKAFISFGSFARGPREEKTEEEKAPSKPATKPTFKGKLNLKGTGANETEADTQASKTNYSFNVTYKPEHKKEGEGANEEEGEPKKKTYGENSHKQPRTFGAETYKKAHDEVDDEFQVVTNKDRNQVRREQVKKQRDNDNDEFKTVEASGSAASKLGPRGGAKFSRGGTFAGLKQE